MDFFTRGSYDLRLTEISYGSKSDQYKLHRTLLDIENRLQKKQCLFLKKECKQETLLIIVKPDADHITVTKEHWDKELCIVRRKTKLNINKSINSFVNNEIYELLVNGKYSIDDNQEKTKSERRGVSDGKR